MIIYVLGNRSCDMNGRLVGAASACMCLYVCEHVQVISMSVQVQCEPSVCLCCSHILVCGNVLFCDSSNLIIFFFMFFISWRWSWVTRCNCFLHDRLRELQWERILFPAPTVCLDERVQVLCRCSAGCWRLTVGFLFHHTVLWVWYLFVVKQRLIIFHIL